MWRTFRQSTASCHGLLRLLVVGVGTGLHFDHHQLAVVRGHDVQLQAVLAPVAVEYRVAPTLQIGCYGVFAFLSQSVVCCHIAVFFLLGRQIYAFSALKLQQER